MAGRLAREGVTEDGCRPGKSSWILLYVFCSLASLCLVDDVQWVQTERSNGNRRGHSQTQLGHPKIMFSATN